MHIKSDAETADSTYNGTFTNGHASSEPVAIVGMSCRLAGGVTNPKQLWELMCQERDCWSKFPTSRFDGETLYHADQERIDRHHTKGGYFLESDPYEFDAQFFNLTAEAASAMDPQLRMLLEGVYEAVEDAGITLDQLAGSNTSVFSGSFGHDYADMLMKDSGSLPASFVTGNGIAMLSNRVSHFFDLKGTSSTVDTGCSGSMVSLHNGVQSIQLGDSDMSIVGASSLILNPDFHVALSSVGVTGPDGRCYSWDSRWQGYGRGEGMVVVLLKRLSHALRDGDRVYSVIRGIASNQDGRTSTITSPSMESQRLLIEQCYQKAGVEMSSIGYVEAHMTGTSGDVIEAEAIARTIGKSRTPGDPVYVGSIKTNVGHTEPVSGLASIVKTAMALQHSHIPANLNYIEPNPNIPQQELNVQVPTTLIPWPKNKALRASVNNFGYGGTNVHAILEAYKPSSGAVSTNGGTHSCSSEEAQASFIFTISARHSAGVVVMNANLAKFIRAAQANHQYISPADLAYTLAVRRSRFHWTTAVRAHDLSDLATRLEQSDRAPVRAAPKPPRIGYVFSGQGAQWYGMGRELLATYDVFAASIERADRLLCEDFGADWSLRDELMADESDSRVHDIALGQPMTVAVQLALVDLLSSWNVRPTAVVSHSSGEIAAAYAAGVLSFSEALGVVYHRGRLAQKYQKLQALSGGMVAVRLDVEEATEYITQIPGREGKVVIACVNSPKSLTLSGDVSAIESLVSVLEEDGIFVRRLKVPMAYHSHHMQYMAQEYREILEKLIKRPRRSNIPFASPVSGTLLNDFQPEHWAQNLTGTVLFSSAIEAMMEIPDHIPEILVEIGAHDTLSGPVRQTLAGKTIPYLGCLQRNVHAVHTVQDLACSLWARGYSLDLGKVNRLDHFKPKFVHSLPSYAWNHASRYSAEPRASREHRNSRFPPQELLGLPIPGSNTLAPTWRNHLRKQDVSWLADHQVDSQVLLPGAAYVSMAIEAARILRHPASPAGYELRDLDIIKGLVIPDTSAGVETTFSLRPCDDKRLDHKDWLYFEVHSVGSDDSWNLHCTGYVLALMTETSPPESPPDEFLPAGTSTKDVDIDNAFSKMRDLGFHYGPTFQNMKGCKVANGKFQAAFNISSAVSQGDYVLHPTTLDAVFQSCYAGLPQEETSGVMLLPRSLKKLTIGKQLGNKAGQEVQCNIRHLEPDKRTIGFDGSAFDPDSTSVGSLHIHDFRLQRLQQNDPSKAKKGSRLGRHARTMWQPDILHDIPKTLRDSWRIHLAEPDMQFEREIREAAFHLIQAAWCELHAEQRSSWPWHGQRLYEWMASIVEQGTQILPFLDSERLATRDEATKQALFDKLAVQNVVGELTVKLGRQLSAIVRGEVQPLQVMMENNLLHRYYQEIPMLHDRSFKHLRSVVELFAVVNPGAKVLEIGAGTGGATFHVLSAFDSQAAGNGKGSMLGSYHFTDVSSGFFPAAKEKFSAWQQIMEFSRLDIESDPIEQGFSEGAYDLIVAAEVLHATKSLESTLRNARRLLKVGGKLVLLESTKSTLDTQMVFGTLPGWWLSSEPERRMSPNADVATWNRKLQRSGFSAVKFEIGDCEHEEVQGSSILVATALGKPIFPPSITIVGDDTTSKEWMESLASEIDKVTNAQYPIEMERFADIKKVSSRVYVLAMDMSQPFLSTVDEDQFNRLRDLMTNSDGFLWLSCGGLASCKNPIWAQTQGLLRTLRREDQNRRFVHLDFDNSVDPWGPAGMGHIVHVLLKTFDYTIPAAQGMDWEYAVKDGMLHVPRIYPDERRDVICSHGSKTITQQQRFSSADEVLTWEVSEGRLGGRPQFSSKAIPSHDDLGPEMVEICPKAFGLNCSDLLTAGGMSKQSGVSGHEASGIVTRVGTDTNLCVGDRVCGLFQGHFSSRPQADWRCVAKIPDGMTWEQAASISYAFTTAHIALHRIGQLQAGEIVLIHSASGDVGQAAVIVAQKLGAKVFITCATQQKRQLMMDKYGIPDSHIFSNASDAFAKAIMSATCGYGVDVVLNSLEGSLLQATWDIMAPTGRFVHTGPMFDIEARRLLPMGPFGRGATFASVDPFQYATAQGEVFQTALMEGIAICEERSNTAMEPIQIFGMTELQKAVEHRVTHAYMGKDVIVPESDEEVDVSRPVEKVRLRRDATYMIVGGVGGVGSAIAAWMAERGAGHLMIVSRNAESHSECGILGSKAGVHDCEVTFRNCNVADQDDLARVLKQLQADGIPPLRGVVNGAMVLSVIFSARAQYAQWTSTMRSKVETTTNLHNLLPALDFFILLSSITGAVGSASQANYTAGNTFQDAFARWRRAQKLPAVTIDLGLITDIRWGAEEEALRGRLEKAFKATVMSSDETMGLVEEAIRNPGPRRETADASQIICYGLQHKDFADDQGIQSDKRWSPLLAAISAEQRLEQESGHGQSEAVSRMDQLMDQLHALTKASSTRGPNEVKKDAVELVTALLIAKAAEDFNLSIADIDPAVPLADHGVDSLVAVQFRNWLRAALKAQVGIFDILENRSLTDFAGCVVEKSSFFVRNDGKK